MASINCVKIREQILTEVRKEVETLQCRPKICIVSIGKDDASQIYIKNKIKTASSVGIDVEHVKLEEHITQEEAELRMKEINSSNDFCGVMLQLPVPKHLDSHRLINVIPQNKDVDGLTDLNIGMLINGHPNAIVPATAMGVFKIISHVLETGDLTGVDVTVVNRSQLIGKPLQALLTNHNATVTVCHSRTDNLQNHTSRSHVVVTGIGQPKYFDSYYFSDYQMIIDCGINRDENNKLCGDVDTDEVLSAYNVGITPVPSGVGILTTSCLMLSVIKCHNLNQERYNEFVCE